MNSTSLTAISYSNLALKSKNYGENFDESIIRFVPNVDEAEIATAPAVNEDQQWIDDMLLLIALMPKHECGVIGNLLSKVTNRANMLQYLSEQNMDRTVVSLEKAK